MSKTYSVQVWVGEMETRYGVDHAHVLADPMTYEENKQVATAHLKQWLGYEDTPCGDYPGRCDDDVGAYFSSEAFDMEIPKSIVERIVKEHQTFLNAVDRVCIDCHYCREEICETCPVRTTVDEMSV